MTDTRGGLNYGDLRNKYSSDPSDFYFRAGESLHLQPQDRMVDGIMNVLRYRISHIHEELTRINIAISDITTTCETLFSIIKGISERYNRQCCIDRPYGSSTAPSDRQRYEKCLDQLLDVTLRHDLYWLSVHVNECRWINIIQSSIKTTFRPYGKFLWNEIKYICPCVVSTFYMAPKLFEYTRNDQLEYNFGLADLLIVDEAGQVSPEIGLPAFAFAQKALVVGDLMQIPPVISTPQSAEANFWARRITSERMQAQRDFLSCCGSSVMAIAEDRCDYERETKSGKRLPGLFLNEHRRCVDEIISYSNELVYNGDLIPKRGSWVDQCHLHELPPIGFYQVGGECEIKDGSRYNLKEIASISEWLKMNANIIEAAYDDGNKKRSITELVCIITPFKEQSRLIKEDAYLKNFPSGTEHTFQGAESPIVIFSLVYAGKDNPFFITQNHELMNVAVSRAKDHFLVFGDMNCLERKLSDPACYLLTKKSEPIPLDL